MLMSKKRLEQYFTNAGFQYLAILGLKKKSRFGSDSATEVKSVYSRHLL
jgi:hypothetical protein